MNDPHVECLHYKATAADFVVIADGSSVKVETAEFDGILADGELVLTMKCHFSTEAEARAIADPFVNGWSIASGLRRVRSEVTFSFLKADIIDRSPEFKGGFSGSAVLPMVHVHGVMTSEPIKIKYPSPVPTFVASPEVQVLWARYQAYIEGREPLLSVAYFCLTFVEAMAGGGPARAAEMCKISKGVFKKIGKLCGEHGDYLTARKVINNKKFKPLSQDKIRWLDSAVRLIIRRVGDSSIDTCEIITDDKIINHDLIALGD